MSEEMRHDCPRRIVRRGLACLRRPKLFDQGKIVVLGVSGLCWPSVLGKLLAGSIHRRRERAWDGNLGVRRLALVLHRQDSRK